MGQEQHSDRDQRWPNKRQEHGEDHHLHLIGVGQECVELLASSLWLKSQDAVMVDFFLANSVLNKDIGKDSLDRIFCLIIKLDGWLLELGLDVP